MIELCYIAFGDKLIIFFDCLLT